MIVATSIIHVNLRTCGKAWNDTDFIKSIEPWAIRAMMGARRSVAQLG
jgi:hypothetical protein